MRTLGICSAEITFRSKQQFSFELRSLYNEGIKYFRKVFLINPKNIRYHFENRYNKPLVFFKDQNISDLTSLIVRGMKGLENQISLFANTLYQNNCNILDPISRFNGLPAGKLFLTLRNHKHSIGSDSYISFNKTDSLKLIRYFADNKLFPVIMKPVYGKHGKYVSLLENKKQSELIIKNHYSNVCELFEELIFQKYIDIKTEFRAITIGLNIIGLCEKTEIPGNTTRNAATGSHFIQTDDDEVYRFLRKNVKPEGIIGIDIARDKNGELFLIETNRAPQWKAFQDATKINIAEKIIQYAYES